MTEKDFIEWLLLANIVQLIEVFFLMLCIGYQEGKYQKQLLNLKKDK